MDAVAVVLTTEDADAVAAEASVTNTATDSTSMHIFFAIMIFLGYKDVKVITGTDVVRSDQRRSQSAERRAPPFTTSAEAKLTCGSCGRDCRAILMLEVMLPPL